MTENKKTVTLAEHVADTHREKEQQGNVVTGDIVSGDLVAKEQEQEPTDAAEENEQESGEDS